MKNSLSYRDAGVDIDRGGRLVEAIKPLAASTHRQGVLGSIGGFGALFELPLDRYRQPVLVSGTDGVGTKLRLAITLGRHDTIGIDLVAMCVNDVLVLGAEPLFFLDYFATGRLDEHIGRDIVAGIAEGCRHAGAALIGGETAEMPGMYRDGDYDLAGFCVGVVEKANILDGSRVCTGDALVGIASSGPHSNGYSLIRKIVEVACVDLDTEFDGSTLGQTLLAPTRIYVRQVLDLLAHADVHAIAHITGGGLIDNIPRVLPPGTRARLDVSAWPRQPVFEWLERTGGVEPREMLRTFNCGIGLVLVVPESAVGEAIARMAAAGDRAWRIGTVEAAPGAEAHVAVD